MDECKPFHILCLVGCLMSFHQNRCVSLCVYVWCLTGWVCGPFSTYRWSSAMLRRVTLTGTVSVDAIERGTPT